MKRRFSAPTERLLASILPGKTKHVVVTIGKGGDLWLAKCERLAQTDR